MFAIGHGLRAGTASVVNLVFASALYRPSQKRACVHVCISNLILKLTSPEEADVTCRIQSTKSVVTDDFSATYIFAAIALKAFPGLADTWKKLVLVLGAHWVGLVQYTHPTGKRRTRPRSGTSLRR